MLLNLNEFKKGLLRESSGKLHRHQMKVLQKVLNMFILYPQKSEALFLSIFKQHSSSNSDDTYTAYEKFT